MYKVLIIDDEEPLREAIKILGDWKGLQVDEVLEATNGMNGLIMLKEHHPDLIMVDMKMPEMNGVEFLRAVEAEYPELLTIVISGYNDFEFTRQAIRSRVVDYLLKPVNRQDLNAALRKAFDILEAKRESQSEFIQRNIAYNMSLPKLKEKIYLSIIERNFKKQSNRAFLQLIGADQKENHFGALVLRVLNMQSVRDSRFNKDTELLYFAITNVVNEARVDGVTCFGLSNPKQDGEFVAVYTFTGGYPEDWAYKADYLMRKIGSTLSELFGITVACGTGKIYEDIIGLAESYEEARASVLEIDLLRMTGTNVYGSGNCGRSPELYSLTSRIPVLRNAMEAGNLNNAKVAIEELIDHIRACGYFPLKRADRMIRELIVLMNDIALELGAPADKLPSTPLRRLLAPLNLSVDFTTFKEFEELLYRVLEFYLETIRKSMADSRPFQIKDIKDYIDKYYFEDIKISMFTEKYFLSREYLMKLFKQQFGFGIHEYVQKVRMERASELLAHSELKIQEISEMLGYKDKNYFSKAFRNYYGVSPSEFRAGQAREKK